MNRARATGRGLARGSIDEADRPGPTVRTRNSCMKDGASFREDSTAGVDWVNGVDGVLKVVMTAIRAVRLDR